MLFATWWGACTASLLGVVADRGSWRDARTARSRCVCGTTVGPIALLPVIGWVLSRGRARCCGARIPARYPLAEAALGAVWGLAAAGCWLIAGTSPAWGAVSVAAWAATAAVSGHLTLRRLRNA